MSAIEIFKLINEIMPVGKLSSGIVASFFIIPIRPEFSWELLLFLYIIIGAVFGAILLFTTLTPHHLGDMSHQIPHNILSFADQTLNRTDTFVFSYSPYWE